MIEQFTYLNANYPEKNVGTGLVLAALAVGLITAVICSLSVLGNRLLEAYSDMESQGRNKSDRPPSERG